METFAKLVHPYIDSVNAVESKGHHSVSAMFYTVQDFIALKYPDLIDLNNYEVRWALEHNVRIVGEDFVTSDGRMSVRLRKMLYKQYGISVSGDELSAMMNKIKPYDTPTLNTFWRLYDEIDWEDGCYGHSGSCYWGCYYQSKPTLINAGGLGMLFHSESPVSHENGIARIWVYPIPDTRCAVLFNAYGRLSNGRGMEKETGATILIDWLQEKTGLRYIQERIGFSNIDNDDIPYINGNCGILIYPDGESLDFLHYGDYTADMEVIDEIGVYDRVCQCEACGSIVDRDSITEIEGESICPDCLDFYYTQCPHCGEYFRNNN